IKHHIRPGRPANAAMDELFARLACAFFAIFGHAPTLDTTRTDGNQASLRWALTVLRLAVERVTDSVLLNISESERKVIAPQLSIVQITSDAAALKPATVADRLRKGWLAWRGMPKYIRWPVYIWHPLGWEPTESPVPPWCRNRS
ncbi:MAG: hypothetical protein ACREF3_18950, partial [Acetobacteraceae bacterium]